MRRFHFFQLWMILLTLCGIACLAQAQEKETKKEEKESVRIGVYDSRAVAYVQFSSEANLKIINEAVAKAKEAQKTMDKKAAEELANQFKEGQRKIHRQVFSMAPIDDVLEKIKDRLPEIQKKAGVSVLISKWDEEKLKQYPKAEKIDVTDALVEEFKPTEKQKKMLEEIKKTKPLSLEEADKCD
jgi:hypothetical protein